MRRLPFLLLLLLFACADEAPVDERPNIVLIYADDLGYGDLGSYGQQLIATPHLDSLAAGGLRFTDHYAGSTVCAPSRASLLTGLHQGHAPVRGNRDMLLTPTDTTFVARLQAVGYRTALYGKWSLGDAGTTGEPTAVGFDEYYGYLSQTRAHNYYPEYLMENGVRVALPNEVKLAPDTYAKGLSGASTNRAAYSHDLFTQKALDYIARPVDTPFFLFLPYTIPHANNESYLLDRHGMEVPDLGAYADKDWPEAERGKAAMISRLDADVGRIIAKLRATGKLKNTVVLFTSDNGPHAEGGVDPDFFDSNGPLRGTKRDLYDGGIRVPLIVYQPGTIPAGKTTKMISASYDLGPTFIELAEAEPLRDIDGISLVPTLTGRGKQAQHEYLYWEFTEGNRQTWAVRQEDWKYVENLSIGEGELYRIAVDPAEEDEISALWPRRTRKMKAYAEAAHVPHPSYPLPSER